jgi:hypothetical protein
MVRDEAPAATTGGINGWDKTAREPVRLDLPNLNPRQRSDQRRCCGNPSWTTPVPSTTAGRSAAFKLCATPLENNIIKNQWLTQYNGNSPVHDIRGD